MKILFTLLLAATATLAIAGCNSNPTTSTSNTKFIANVPRAKSEVLETVTVNEQNFEIRYKQDSLGNKIFRTVDSKGEYTGGERESYEAIKQVAQQRMIREAIDQVNGVFIKSKTEIHRTLISRGDNAATMLDVNDETISKVAGFAQMDGNPDCQRFNLDGGATKVVCEGRVRVPEVDIVKTSI